MPEIATATLGVWVGDRLAPRAAARARPVASHRAHGLQGHGAPHRPARSPRTSRTSAATSTPRRASNTRATRARVLGENVDVALDVLGDILTRSAFDAGGAGPREGRDPAGIRRRRGYARRPHLRRLHGDRLRGPGHRPARSSARPTRSRLRRGDHPRLPGAANTHPAKMVLAAAGDVDHAQIVDAAERLFGAMPPSPVHGSRRPAATRAASGGSRAGSNRPTRPRPAGPVLQGPGLLCHPSLRPHSRRRADLAAVARGARDARPRLFDRSPSTGPSPIAACSASAPAPPGRTWRS